MYYNFFHVYLKLFLKHENHTWKEEKGREEKYCKTLLTALSKYSSEIKGRNIKMHLFLFYLGLSTPDQKKVNNTWMLTQSTPNVVDIALSI